MVKISAVSHARDHFTSGCKTVQGIPRL
ncbi:unnamed protein product, partial [Rotaria sp. Silwood2]